MTSEMFWIGTGMIAAGFVFAVVGTWIGDKGNRDD